MSLEDRIVGCIVGGAIGDAMGGAYEGAAGPVPVRPGTKWALSDDTQLTLATCEALLPDGIVSPDRIARSFAAWYAAGRVTGLGASTLKALRDLAAGAHWALAGRGGEMAAGNGAAMRIAPLAFFLDPASDEDRRTLRDVCRITHKHDEAYAGALAVVLAVREVALGRFDPGAPLLPVVAAALPDSLVRDRLVEMAALAPDFPLSGVARRYGCSGYVVESVPFALFAVQSLVGAGLAPVLEAVVGAGGDADTNASIAGQVAGARLGARAIPDALVQRLPDADALLATARRVAAAARA